jgi:hypothetical protein
VPLTKEGELLKARIMLILLNIMMLCSRCSRKELCLQFVSGFEVNDLILSKFGFHANVYVYVTIFMYNGLAHILVIMIKIYRTYSI